MNLGYFSHSNISPSETFIFDLVKGLIEDNQINLIYVYGGINALNESYNIKNISTGFSGKYNRVSSYIRKLGQLFGGNGDNWKLSFNQMVSLRQLKNSNLPNFDVAFIDYATTGVLVMDYLKRENIPFIVHVHGYDITSSTSDKTFLKNLKKLFTEARNFVAASEYMKRRLILLGCDESKISVIKYGVASTLVPPISWKDRIKLSPSIIFLGRLTDKKHPVALLHAFKIVRKVIPNAKLTIIGDGHLKEEVVLEISRLGLSEDVTMMGVLNRNQSFPIMNKHWIYAQHSVTGLNGDTEGFAISLAEAALHELPVVSTIHNGITENVIDGVTGFLVPEYDYEAMAEKIIFLIKNPQIAEHMGKAGREHIMNICDQEVRIKNIKSLLNNMLSLDNKY